MLKVTATKNKTIFVIRIGVVQIMLKRCGVT